MRIVATACSLTEARAYLRQKHLLQRALKSALAFSRSNYVIRSFTANFATHANASKRFVGASDHSLQACGSAKLA